MKIVVGSTNPVKIAAVKETITDYPLFDGSEVIGIKMDIDVSDQLKSLSEIIKGAKYRAKEAFESTEDCDYGFGIENGLMKVPETNTGYMDIGACVIYDGKNYHIGLSSAFEYPEKVVDYAFDKGVNIAQSFFRAGLRKQNEGQSRGVIGILTRGRLVRKDSIKQAITTALIHLDK